MNEVGSLRQRKEARSWVQFEQRAVENERLTKERGQWVGQDVEFVIITPPYGRDDVHKEVQVWLEEMKLKVANGRLSEEDRTYYIGRYEAWKKGIESPPDGTPIKGWAVISPAQQKTILGMGIQTVEELAQVNDEGMRRIGMGSVELKRKANAWIAQAQDKGPLTIQMAAVQSKNDQLQIEVEALRKQLTEAVALISRPQQVPPAGAEIIQDAIDVVDLLPDDPPKRGPGRPKKDG